MSVGLQAEDLGDDDGRHRPLGRCRGPASRTATSTEPSRADGDRARRWAARRPAAPGVQGHADAVLDRPLSALARRVPLLLPVGQLGGDLDLAACRSCCAWRRIRRAASVLAAVGVVGRQVLQPHLHRVDAELGRQVVDGALGQEAALRMAGAAHGPGLAGVEPDDRVLALRRWDDVVDVGQQVEVDGGAAGRRRASRSNRPRRR